MKIFIISILTLLVALACGGITVMNDSLMAARTEVTGLQEQLDAVGKQLVETDTALGKSENSLAERELRLAALERSYAELSSKYAAALESPPDPPIRIVEVEKEVIREVEKEVPLEIIPWQSLDELKEFLGQSHEDVVLHADEQGNVQFESQCEDLAFSLCARARAAGRLIETEILVLSEVLKYYSGQQIDAPHCICKAFVGNNVYYIEPFDHRYWLAYYLDDQEEE